MGLDLLIREQKNFRTNEKGNTVWEVEQLCNLRNCWNFAQSIGIENCTTINIGCEEIFDFIEDIENDNEKNYILEELESAGISKDDERTFEVHAWW
jgi:hypothetical protein